MNLVPTPRTVSTSTRPFSRSMDFSTTSSPTPRPETSVIASRVEKPWAKMSCTTSRSESASSPFSRPRATALACTRAASMPEPSSMIVITTWFDSWAAESRIVPVGVLPRATRSAGRLDAVVDAVPDQVDERLADLVDDRLVDAGVLALQDQLDVLAGLAGEVAHQAREALEDVADGEHADVHDRLLQRGGDGRDLLHRGLQLAARLAAAELLRHLLAELLQLGAMDDQLADQVQQVVELGEVHADHVRARRRRTARRRGGAPVPRRSAAGGGGVGAAGAAGRRRRGARRGAPFSGAARLEHPVQRRRLRREVADLAVALAGLLDGVPQRGRPREQRVEDLRGRA